MNIILKFEKLLIIICKISPRLGGNLQVRSLVGVGFRYEKKYSDHDYVFYSFAYFKLILKKISLLLI